MICARGLRRTFQTTGSDREVLRGVDLEVADDEFVAIMGPSGCGKSTLLGLLGGLDVPDHGEVLLGGIDISRMDEEARARVRRERMGFVFQRFHLIPSLTVVENVALTAIVSGERPRRWRGRASELLETLGIGELSGRRPDRLSGGEQQRVAVARAVFRDPTVLLADEPTGSLDSANGRAVLDLFQAARAAGHLRSIVMVTHDADAASIADRVVIMHDGTTVGSVLSDEAEGADRAQSLRLRLASAHV